MSDIEKLADAIKDLAAAIRYHANRLPPPPGGHVGGWGGLPLTGGGGAGSFPVTIGAGGGGAGGNSF